VVDDRLPTTSTIEFVALFAARTTRLASIAARGKIIALPRNPENVHVLPALQRRQMHETMQKGKGEEEKEGQEGKIVDCLFLYSTR
jgi:hypothetical protein